MTTEVLKNLTAPPALEKKPQVAYKTEIIGGVVVQTPISQVLLLGAAGGSKDMPTVPKDQHIATGWGVVVKRVARKIRCRVDVVTAHQEVEAMASWHLADVWPVCFCLGPKRTNTWKA